MAASPWKYFTWEELACQCRCGKVDMDARFMSRVVALRETLNTPFVVRSAFRCPDHNERVSRTKSRTGPHTTGRAIDIELRGLKVYQSLSLVEQLGFTGIGLDQKAAIRYIHLDDLDGSDTQPRPHVWTY